MKDTTIYHNCPVYTSENFRLRLVELDDASDLLRCYSDPTAVRLMNADNCTSDFYYQTLDEMCECIEGWLGAYEHKNFIRFSIIDIHTQTAIGTIEMFDKTNEVGILRLDINSSYETYENICELINLSVRNFRDAFGVQRILMKAIPEATERVSVLKEYGFVPIKRRRSIPFDDYYIYDEV